MIKDVEVGKPKVFERIGVGRISMGADQNRMRHVRPQSRVANRDVLNIAVEISAMPVNGDAIVRIPHEHALDHDVGTAEDINAIVISATTDGLDAFESDVLRLSHQNRVAAGHDDNPADDDVG